MNSSSRLISIKQASQMLGVTALTLRNWDKKGKLTPSRHPINNYRVYKREDIERLIEEIGANKTPIERVAKKKGPRKLQVKHLD